MLVMQLFKGNHGDRHFLRHEKVTPHLSFHPICQDLSVSMLFPLPRS